METMSSQCDISFSQPNADELVISLSGGWKMENEIPSAEDTWGQIEQYSPLKRVTFKADGITSWDSGLLTFLIKIIGLCEKKDIKVDKEGLPEGVRKLFHLATAIPERKGARREDDKVSALERVGQEAVNFWDSLIDMVGFIGEASVATLRLLTGKARFQRSELFLVIQETGVQALPIVSLISLLVGLIFAFVGSIQLLMFGAEVYVASLVGIAMVRVMGAIMTGIIMAGRTGASFAAKLGTMQVNEEIDALTSQGISPMEFLVLPRMIALVIMMPLLCLYSNLMGIIGGMIVGVGLLDIDIAQYVNMTNQTVRMTDLWVGLFHGTVFGVLIAISGCMRGMQCGRSASAVGEATTSAVVTGIVSIVVATAIITVIFNILGI